MSITDQDPVADAATSLAGRMRAVRDERESATTEDFPVPGWSDFAWVRLRVLSHKEQRKQVEKNRKVRDRGLVELYVAADTIMAATDGFYEVKPEKDGEEAPLEPIQTSWIELAKGVFDLGTDITPRAAFIRLVGSERVVPFYAQYIDWLNGEREDISEEQREDFQETQ